MQRYKIQPKFFVLWQIIVLIAFLFASNTLAQQQGKRIESIDLQGNRRLSDEEILKHIKTRPGQRLDEKQLQQDLQSLVKLGVFHATNTTVLTEPGVRGGVDIIFKVFELPIISKLNIEGLHYISPEEILFELRGQKVEVKVGTPYQPQKMKEISRLVLQYLGKRGFPDANFVISEEQETATTVIIRFIIDELPSVEEDNCCEDDNFLNESLN